MKKYSIVSVVLFCLIVLSGCGPKAPYSVVPIEGTATWNGKPIPQDFILKFRPENGMNESTGFIKGDGGKFATIHTVDIDGVPAGKCTVRVLWGGPEGTTPPQEYAPLIKSYGFGSDGLPLKITKKDLSLKIDFPAENQ